MLALGLNDTEEQCSINIDRKSIMDKTTPPNSPNIGMQYLPPSSKQVNCLILILRHAGSYLGDISGIILREEFSSKMYLLVMDYNNYIKCIL